MAICIFYFAHGPRLARQYKRAGGGSHVVSYAEYWPIVIEAAKFPQFEDARNKRLFLGKVIIYQVILNFIVTG